VQTAKRQQTRYGPARKINEKPITDRFLRKAAGFYVIFTSNACTLEKVDLLLYSMKRIPCLIALALLLSVAALRGVAEPGRVWFSVPVSTQDSIGVEKKDGKRFIMHRVNEGQTLYAIARRYRSSVDAIKAANPNLNGNVRYGQVIRVPLAEASLSRKEKKAIDKAIKKDEKEKERSVKAEPASKPVKTARKSEDPAKAGIHVVEPGQTLYSLAVRYGVSQAEIRRWNDLSNDNVLIGQALIVSEKAHQSRMPSPSNPAAAARTDTPAKTTVTRPEVSRPEPRTEPERTETPVARTERPAPKRPEETPGPTTEEVRNVPLPRPADAEILLPRPGNDAPMPTRGRRISENGVAELIDGASDSNKYLALHRTAPAGTLVQVRNEFNNQSIWVKVIGKLPDTGINDKILIKLSARAFEKLSPQDRRFRAEVSYLVP